MEMAAKNLHFERAAFFRDKIRALERVTQKQKIISTSMLDQDVIAIARANGEACAQVFFIREGKLLGREHFVLDGTQDEDPRLIMTNFVVQFYDSAAQIPEIVLLQHQVKEPMVIQTWLSGKRGSKVLLRVPRRGEKKRQVEMVEQNAAEALEQIRAKWLADDYKTGIAIVELAEKLGLDRPPMRIECYDISNIQGTSAVGSMVVFEKGQPKKSEYRRFQVRGVKGPDDYAMMRDVLSRRFRRAGNRIENATSNEESAWARLPDLVIVDGGKGQLNVAAEVLQGAGFSHLAVAALAKENEALYVPETLEPVMLPRTSPALYLIQRIRDEAHRFALAYHQRVRSKQALASPLNDVPGVGPKRKAALLRCFGSLKAVREATIEELAAAPMMTRRLAQILKQYL
jgi:excinuclease ABC subunit C